MKNFTKYSFVVTATFVTLFFLSCTKSSYSPPSTISGVWKIRSDLRSGANGMTPNDVVSSTYTGTAADHYIFSQNGSLFIKEALESDTGTYSVTAGNKLSIIYTVIHIGTFRTFGTTGGGYDISNLTAHTLTLSYNWFTPAGPRQALLQLYR